MKYTALILTACSALTIISCGEKKTAKTDSTSIYNNLLESVIVKDAPADAKSITEIRKSIEVGKKVTLSGKVMGRIDPFVEGRALLIIGDPAIITSCDLMPGDNCPTPWDVCCDDIDDVKAATATIQIVDKNGKIIKHGLKGLHGIKELSQLVITGKIAEGSSADNLLINATEIYVKP